MSIGFAPGTFLLMLVWHVFFLWQKKANAQGKTRPLKFPALSKFYESKGRNENSRVLRVMYSQAWRNNTDVTTKFLALQKTQFEIYFTSNQIIKLPKNVKWSLFLKETTKIQSS